MKKSLFTVLGFIFTLAASTAWSNELRTITLVDEAGMPVCIVKTKASDRRLKDFDTGIAKGEAYLVFDFSSDLYSRPITMTAKINDTRRVRAKVGPLTGKFAKMETYTNDCWGRGEERVYERFNIAEDTKMDNPKSAEARALMSDISSDGFGSVSKLYDPESDYEFAGFDLSSPKLRRALAQTLKGGTVYLEEGITPQNYMAKMGIQEYTKAVNREISARHGIPFSTEVYRHYIKSRPANQSFQASLLNRFGNYSNSRSAFQQDSQSVQKYTVVYAKGYGHTINAGETYLPIYKAFKEMQTEIITVETLPFGTIEENQVIFADTLERELRKGKDVIVTAGSRGVTEMLGALNILSDKITNPPPGYGRVKGAISLAGMLDGMFMADFLTSFPVWQFAARGMVRQAVKNCCGPDGEMVPLTVEQANALKTIRPGRVKKLIDGMTNLPPITYVGVVGVSPIINGQGAPALKEALTQVARGRMRSGYGANDGYIEYPGSGFPRQLIQSAGGTLYEPLISSSHLFLDGAVEGIPLVRDFGTQSIKEAIDQGKDADAMRLILGLFAEIDARVSNK